VDEVRDHIVFTAWTPLRHRSAAAREHCQRVAGDLPDPRGHTPVPPAPIARQLDPVEIRPAELQVFVDGRRVGFTVREFQIFSVLAERPDRVVRRDEIHENVWGTPWVHRDRSVDVFVRKVRRKLAAISPEWIYIHTHFGIGYRYAPEHQPSQSDSD